MTGTLWLAIPIALAAGFISFASPCVLPLVPGYLAYVSGFSDGREERASRNRTLLGASLFVAGFGVVYVAMNFALSRLSMQFLPYMNTTVRIMGFVVIVMGLVFIGQFAAMQRQVKSKWRPRLGVAGAPLLGVVFAFGWTPCIGPTLVALYSLSIPGEAAWRPILLATIYTAGLGIPFMLVALGTTWATRSIGFLRRHIRVVNIIGGVMLIIMGVLMATGLWQSLLSWFLALVPGYVAPL